MNPEQEKESTEKKSDAEVKDLTPEKDPAGGGGIPLSRPVVGATPAADGSARGIPLNKPIVG